MKLLLLQPPIQDFYDTDIRLQPIGLCYLKAAVHKYLPEVQVIIKDYHQGWGRRPIPIPKALAHLKEFYLWPDKSPFATFYHYYHFGAGFDALAADVAAEQPDLVGISALFTPYYHEVLQCADAIKKHLNVPILVGGAHVSAAPLTVLSHPGVDFIIRGEGERPLVEFLSAWPTGHPLDSVPSLGFKKNGVPVLNPLAENYPLAQLPLPDLSDLEPGRYRYDGRPLSFMFTSRGCPYHCSFCAVHLTFGRRYQKRPVQAILEEMQRKYDLGYRVFDFEDDNLTFHMDEMKALCQKISANFPPNTIQLLAMNGICYWNLDAELLQLMHQAGFSHLNLSLVSSNAAVLARSHRPMAPEKLAEVVAAGFRLGFKIVCYQILGLPNETLDSMIATILDLSRLPALIGPSPFYLPPATPIASTFPELSEWDFIRARLTAFSIETAHFDRADIYTLYITTRIINFLKGLRFAADKNDLIDAFALARRLGRRSALGAEVLERLLSEGVLCAATANGFKPLPRFKTPLFLQVWQKLNRIVTQTGKEIYLH